MSARFCAACGAALARLPGQRHPACPACGQVAWENPAVEVGCVAQGPGASIVLRIARLARAEKIQSAALRALGSSAAGVREDQLALYCTLGDLARGTVCIVFRACVPLATAAGAAGPVPPWAGELCARYTTDRVAPRMPVYTGRYDGSTLVLDAVRAEA